MNDQPAPKFCRDCRHLRPVEACAHPRAHSFNLVTGEEDPFKSAHAMRMPMSDCGTEGKLWELKESVGVT